MQHRFPLETGNRKVAAKKAAAIYAHLTVHGWEATLEKFSPSNAKVEAAVTIGEIVRAVGELTEVRPATFAEYVQAMRRIASDIKRIPGTTKRGKHFTMAADGEARKRWVAKVDAVPVAEITPDKVERWKHNFIKARSGTEVETASAKRSANAFIRKARSLFGRKAQKALLNIDLPDPLPFDGVELFKVEQSRYRSKIDAEQLFRDAVAELSVEESEAFKVFLLAIGAGLRRSEIDTLQWDQFDATEATVEIKTTDYFRPKSSDSAGVVELDRELAAILQGFRAKAEGGFVIESELAPRVGTTFRYYRCGEAFKTLSDWLVSKGLGTGDRRKSKPIHLLRKEFGSLLVGKYGLFAASRALRHADVSVTASHYLDKKERVSVGLGALINATADEEEAAK